MPPGVQETVSALRERLLDELGDELVGLYLYGSLVSGDFDPVRSDIDLIAAVTTQREVAALARFHAAFARSHPVWGERIELAYVPLDGLRTFKSRHTAVAIIEPGAPLEVKEIGPEGVIHYYLVREQSVTLHGPPPQTLIDEISVAEYLAAVRAYLARWREPLAVSANLGPQRYAVLTMCRGLYTLALARPASKRHAAEWAQATFPEWAATIERALASSDDEPNSERDHERATRFVDFALRAAKLSAPVDSHAQPESDLDGLRRRA